MKKEENVAPKLSPKEYKKILADVHLDSINLNSCSAIVKQEKLGKEMKINVKDKVTYSLPEENEVVFVQQYELISTKKTLRDYALKISCSFNVKFSSEAPLSDDFLKIFSQVNLHVNTWLYFREFVQNTAQRMCLPPITLPLLK